MSTLNRTNFDEDCLSQALKQLGYSLSPDYWLETEILLSTEVNLDGALIRYRLEQETLLVCHYELPTSHSSLKNPFFGLFHLIEIIREHNLPLKYFKGKPEALSHGRLSLERLQRFYRRMGATPLADNEPGWIRFDLSPWLSSKVTATAKRLASRAE